MKINVIGDGSFGTFLKSQLPNCGFEIVQQHHNDVPVILAVPIDAYEVEALHHQGKHLINVCSVQEPSTKILLKYTDKVTSIHPLFGCRTPIDKRNTILTYKYNPTDKSQETFLRCWSSFSCILDTFKEDVFTPEIHDKLMAKTHFAAIIAAKQLKRFVDDASDIPDEFIPNSFRLLRQFVQTLQDMPTGTVESIMANPYA